MAALSATDPARSVLIQERIAGDEYGFDVVNDLRGRYVTTLVRRKLRMRAGQTDRAEAVRHERSKRSASGSAGISATSACWTAMRSPTPPAATCWTSIRASAAGIHFPIPPARTYLPPWSRGCAAKTEQSWLQITPHVRVARYDGFLRLNDRDRVHAAECVGVLHADSPHHEMRLT